MHEIQPWGWETPPTPQGCLERGADATKESPPRKTVLCWMPPSEEPAPFSVPRVMGVSLVTAYRQWHPLSSNTKFYLQSEILTSFLHPPSPACLSISVLSD